MSGKFLRHAYHRLLANHDESSKRSIEIKDGGDCEGEQGKEGCCQSYAHLSPLGGVGSLRLGGQAASICHSARAAARRSL